MMVTETTERDGQTRTKAAQLKNKIKTKTCQLQVEDQVLPLNHKPTLDPKLAAEVKLLALDIKVVTTSSALQPKPSHNNNNNNNKSKTLTPHL